MENELEYQRMLHKEKKPSDDGILDFIGCKAENAWLNLTKFIKENYDFLPEKIFYGKKYGWCVRYQRKGKILITFFPEKNSFSILIIFGKKEIEKVKQMLSEIDEELVKIFENTKYLHDGKWLWIRVFDIKLIESIKKLIICKRKPKKSENIGVEGGL